MKVNSILKYRLGVTTLILIACSTGGMSFALDMSGARKPSSQKSYCDDPMLRDSELLLNKKYRQSLQRSAILSEAAGDAARELEKSIDLSQNVNVGVLIAGGTATLAAKALSAGAVAASQAAKAPVIAAFMLDEAATSAARHAMLLAYGRALALERIEIAINTATIVSTAQATTSLSYKTIVRKDPSSTQNLLKYLGVDKLGEPGSVIFVSPMGISKGIKLRLAAIDPMISEAHAQVSKWRKKNVNQESFWTGLKAALTLGATDISTAEKVSVAASADQAIAETEVDALKELLHELRQTCSELK